MPLLLHCCMNIQALYATTSLLLYEHSSPVCLYFFTAVWTFKPCMPLLLHCCMNIQAMYATTSSLLYEHSSPVCHYFFTAVWTFKPCMPLLLHCCMNIQALYATTSSLLYEHSSPVCHYFFTAPLSIIHTTSQSGAHKRTTVTFVHITWGFRAKYHKKHVVQLYSVSRYMSLSKYHKTHGVRLYSVSRYMSLSNLNKEHVFTTERAEMRRARQQDGRILIKQCLYQKHVVMLMSKTATFLSTGLSVTLASLWHWPVCPLNHLVNDQTIGYSYSSCHASYCSCHTSYCSCHTSYSGCHTSYRTWLSH